jgi:hypothetical protein
VLSVPQNTTVSNNHIAGGGAAGIRVGIQNGIAREFAGKCTGGPSPQRDCLDAKDCELRGFDRNDIGPCQTGVTRTVNWIAHNTLIEGNVLTELIESGINTTGVGTIIRDNTIEGGNTTAAGIRLIGKHALETSRIERNSISNVVVALNLIQLVQGLEPSTFGSQLTLNDFTGYKNAVLTSMKLKPPDSCYDLISELSVAGRGNFWGTVGCFGLNPALVIKTDGSREPNVTDRHPFSKPVAKTQLIPNPCPEGVNP